VQFIKISSFLKD